MHKKILCLLFFAAYVFADSKNDGAKKNSSAQFEEIFRELIPEQNPKVASIVRHNTIMAPPFKWPVSLASIKQVICCENEAQIEMKTIDEIEIKPIHKGIVIAMDHKNQCVAIQHIVEGGACYISITQNIKFSTSLKVGKIVLHNDVIGTATNEINLILLQPNVEAKPYLMSLFPALTTQTKIKAKL